jgi:glutamine---fructose-6-phosphate transaminase (isomerizing)
VCGIAGFISNEKWSEKIDVSWINAVVRELETALEEPVKWNELNKPLEKLVKKFDELMSFGLHLEIAGDREVAQQMHELLSLLRMGSDKVEKFITENGPTEVMEQLGESFRDNAWQIGSEVLGNVSRVSDLLPSSAFNPECERSMRFVAWAIERVMENLDRLEVRGRDSAGISIQCRLDKRSASKILQEKPVATFFVESEKIENSVKIEFSSYLQTDGSVLATFTFKVANLVGRLGDNTSALRTAIRSEESLWRAAECASAVNIIAHTRWASNGIISLSNCHPVDGSLYGKDHTESSSDTLARFVLNGDVDNYPELVQECLTKRRYAIEPTVTTDAKILPIFYRLGTDLSLTPEDRFAQLMNNCVGSLAIVMQHPSFPQKLFLGQKGSGQSLFIGKVKDGLMVASEVYGLASCTRFSYALVGTEKGGTQVTLDACIESGDEFTGRYLADFQPLSLRGDSIYIHSRDIFRGDFDYYFEKEIHEAPSSVRKTSKGKYRKHGDGIEFNTDAQGAFGRLLSRFRDPELQPIKRIMVIGQGTASIAAMGVAHLIQKALCRTKISVDWRKASEMSGFLSNEPLGDMLLVAISQSGTTTDTNRTVDVAGSQGAWIHAIVNRRNSPLVGKSNSHFYTSDGRDVEMAVASTKAFYSQVAAGKLTALFMAQELNCMTKEEILQEIEELERLPSDIQWVLDQAASIDLSAAEYGPSSRNWAVVGNGPNKIAADEIRIKLSELCYKSIPCDYTEDKKHIDLSTEPLTIVVANDLPDQLIQDTVKEVSIFKAHNGRPLVFCSRGEKRFNEYAESIIELPPAGAGLGFVVATVAGHLWGFYAAKAIDLKADSLRKLRTILTQVIELPESWNEEEFKSSWLEMMQLIRTGEMNAALPASNVAALAEYGSTIVGCVPAIDMPASWAAEGIGILNKAIEELTRPIDSIRHQAKTVTVGISRPQEILASILLKALEDLSTLPGQIQEIDRRFLRIVSPIISQVQGGIYYKLLESSDAGLGVFGTETPSVRAVKRFGYCVGKGSRYDDPKPAGGTKRTVLRMGRAVLSSGRDGEENLLLIPIFDEATSDCQGIVLLHLIFVPQASLQQKISVLRGMRNRYHEFIERMEDLSGSHSIDDFLENISPRDLVLAPIENLVTARQ